MNMRWRPGQHCFLRFTSFGLQAFSSHPFTICSLPDAHGNDKSDLVFYIRQSHGLTKRLYDYAQKNPKAVVPIMVDGPYGGINMQRFNEADHLLVIAGGSGAGWILSLLELYCRQQASAYNLESSTHAPDKDVESGTGIAGIGNCSYHRKLHVVLATRDTNSRLWFLATVHKLLDKYSISHQSPGIAIDVHLTGKVENFVSAGGFDETKTHSSPSDEISVETEGDDVAPSAKQTSGRPNLTHIICEESEVASKETKSLSVYICGPTTMQNDVRNAVAKENLSRLTGSKLGRVYLHSEHFSWA